jgi:hypothetical protein
LGDLVILTILGVAHDFPDVRKELLGVEDDAVFDGVLDPTDPDGYVRLVDLERTGFSSLAAKTWTALFYHRPGTSRKVAGSGGVNGGAGVSHNGVSK